ncbi:MAG: AEC family transporter [Eubacteriales bacterium]|nr:AEC family transporter [Eubacteriales bacterium]
MNTSLVLMSKLASMLLVAAVGYLTIHTGILEDRDKTQLTRLTLYVLQPCLIVLAFQIEHTSEKLKGFLAALVFSTVIHLVFIVVSECLQRLGFLGVVEQISVVFTNCGNLILPIVSMTLGEEMVFYASAYQISYNLLFWTYGNSRMQGSRSVQWKKMLLNPNVIAIFLGILLLVTGIRIPGIVRTSMEMLEAMVGPSCMLVIGMTLAGSRMRELLTLKKAYLVSFLRLIVFPILALGLLKASGVLARFPEWIPALRVSMLAVAAPPAANVAQTAVLYEREPVNAGIYNLLGMLCCILTMPLIDYLYVALF